MTLALAEPLKAALAEAEGALGDPRALAQAPLEVLTLVQQSIGEPWYAAMDIWRDTTHSRASVVTPRAAHCRAAGPAFGVRRRGRDRRGRQRHPVVLRPAESTLVAAMQARRAAALWVREAGF